MGRDPDFRVRLVTAQGEADLSVITIDGIDGLHPNNGDTLIWSATQQKWIAAVGGVGTGLVQTIVPGPNIAVDNTDPTNPVVSATAGGGSGFDYTQQANPGAVGAGKLWLRLPANVNPAAWQANHRYGDQALVQPTVPNGHFYGIDTTGTSGGSEPVFPTNGSTVADGSATWFDAGLISATVDGWNATPSLFRRNPDNTGWNRVGPGDIYGAGEWFAVDAAGQLVGRIAMQPFEGVDILAYDADGFEVVDVATVKTGVWYVQVANEIGTLPTGTVNVTKDQVLLQVRDGSADANLRVELVAGVAQFGLFGNSVPQGAPIPDATDGPSAIVAINALLAHVRARGDIAT